jgi:hypothetical protein
VKASIASSRKPCSATPTPRSPKNVSTSNTCKTCSLSKAASYPITPLITPASISSGKLSTRITTLSKERLQHAIGAEWPTKVISEKTADGIVLSRPAVGDRVPGILIEGKGPVVLVIDPKGAAAARQNAEVAALIKENRRILLLDAFQTGTAVSPRNRSHNHFLTFNFSDDACRVQDILTAAAFLGGPVEVLGLGDAAVWSYFAAAVSPTPLKLRAPIVNFIGSDEDFLRVLNIPGIQRAGGLQAAKLVLKQSAASPSLSLQ